MMAPNEGRYVRAWANKLRRGEAIFDLSVRAVQWMLIPIGLFAVTVVWLTSSRSEEEE